jgi:hypothetical protein
MQYLPLIGFTLKMYDDLDELYLCKDKRIMECVKTLHTVLIFYFLFKVATNKYDYLWLLFFWLLLPLVDWYAYSDPYYVSLVLFIPLITLILILANKYTYSITRLGLVFLLYCIYTPVTETYCFDLNGPLYELLKKYRILDRSSFNNLSKTDLEVSHVKMYTRIKTVTYYVIMLGILYYAMKKIHNVEMKDLLSSCSQLCALFISYLILSICNQTYVLYFNPSLIDLHRKINNEEVK